MKPKECKRLRGAKTGTMEKYRHAVELYGSTPMPCTEICRMCGVSLPGLQAHIHKYHRHLMLARNGVACSPGEAATIELGSFGRQKPATHAKYRKAIEACDSMENIGMNISQIARQFGLDGTNLGRQLRTHYPEILERRERERHRLGLNDNLPRGSRPACLEQYARAVEMLKGKDYITLQEAADACGVSYPGLKQHVLFYHKELVDGRIKTRKQALRQQCKGKVTGRGSVHKPSPAMEEKYAAALHLYRTTTMPAARIAKETQVSGKGFYDYLQRWHMELVCQRRGVPYEEGVAVDLSQAKKYNPATAAKYADAIKELKEGGMPLAKVAAGHGLHPETFRSYLKEHEPELHASLGRMKTGDGKSVSRRCLEKYGEAVRLYGTTSEPLISIARRCGLNDCTLRDFLKRHYPELVERRRSVRV